MFLSKIHIIHFKNYAEAELEFDSNINCFVGNNGAGKTNLLDAIYYLSFTKSYFNNIDAQNIRHGADFFAIHGFYSQPGGAIDPVSCIQKLGHKKQFKINQKEYDRLSDHIGQFPCVMISPYDRDLINEGSDFRRKFLDSVVSQFDKTYLEQLIRYNHLLEQRNALLKQAATVSGSLTDMFSLLDEQMQPLATIISGKRQQFINDFLPIFTRFYQSISSRNEIPDIRYESHLYQNSFLELMKESFEKDLLQRYTGKGIHKDDLLFEIGGFPIKKYGSQGQQKSFVVALKLAQYEFTKLRVGFCPILLLDDIFDKLDEQRIGQLLALVSSEQFGQVFITDTHLQRISTIFESLNLQYRIFKTVSGTVTESPTTHA